MKRGHFRLLIVGCGNLGGRHLQAVASLPQVGHIDVIDPRPEALEKGRQLLVDVPAHSPSPSIRWVTSLDEVATSGNLCIVATQAQGRAKLIKQVATSLKYKKFLIEKIVTQSVSEYSDLLNFSKENELSIWVNCKSRAHPSHQRVKESLKKGEPVIFSVTGGNYGLANNGVHAADLFSFFSDEKEIKLAASFVDPVLHSSKRGKDIFDLSGTLHGFTDNGSQFSLSLTGSPDGPAHFAVSTPSYRAFIDDFMRWFFESRKETGWIWEKVPYEANLMVSHMTKAFASAILEKGTCPLPTLEECWPAHRFILESLQPYFEKLLKKDLGYCPVT